MKHLEESLNLSLDFKKLQSIFSKSTHDVLPVVVQHVETKEVLILAYVSEEALAHSIKTELATFWSTSRNELWVKGKTSGDTLHLKEIRVNCEQNSLLFLVLPEKKGVCHTKDKSSNARSTCFYRTVDNNSLFFLD
jgi:phosphoribosyl-AMP cyclohydrolase